MAILLLQVDPDETTPIGVYTNWRDALAAAHTDAFRDEGPDDDAEAVFNDMFTRAFEPYERAPSDEGMDFEFESGVGAWSYRLVHVQVYGG